MRLVVFKLGGSLLRCPDLSARLQTLLSEFEGSRVLIVVGGGGAADVVREWSERFGLSEESAHWIALRSLSVTRALIKTLLPDCHDVKLRDEAARIWKESNPPLLLDIESYLSQTETLDPEPLPHDWDTTSDSIAAWAAIRWDADELVLLKSANLPADVTAELAASADLVDAWFPRLASQIPQISWCNLSAGPSTITPWLKHGRSRLG